MRAGQIRKRELNLSDMTTDLLVFKIRQGHRPIEACLRAMKWQWAIITGWLCGLIVMSAYFE